MRIRITVAQRSPGEQEDYAFTNCSMPSAKEIEDSLRDAFAVLEKTKNDTPEVFVLTYSQFAKLENMTYRSVESSFYGAGPDSLYGIRIEKYPSKKEVDERVTELRILGKTVGVIAGD